MRLSTPLMAGFGTVAGLAVAVTTYQSQAPADQPRVSAAAPRPADTSAMTYPPRHTVLWLPCAAGSHLRGRTCVHVEHRVVTVRVPAAPSVAPVQARRVAPQAAARPAPGHRDATTHDSAEHDDDHESDEPDDDHDQPDD